MPIFGHRGQQKKTIFGSRGPTFGPRAWHPRPRPFMVQPRSPRWPAAECRQIKHGGSIIRPERRSSSGIRDVYSHRFHIVNIVHHNKKKNPQHALPRILTLNTPATRPRIPRLIRATARARQRRGTLCAKVKVALALHLAGHSSLRSTGTLLRLLQLPGDLRFKFNRTWSWCRWQLRHGTKTSGYDKQIISHRPGTQHPNQRHASRVHAEHESSASV